MYLYLQQDVRNKIRINIVREKIKFLNEVPVQICFNNVPEMSAIRSDVFPRHAYVYVYFRPIKLFFAAANAKRQNFFLIPPYHLTWRRIIVHIRNKDLIYKFPSINFYAISIPFYDDN